MTPKVTPQYTRISLHSSYLGVVLDLCNWMNDLGTNPDMSIPKAYHAASNQ